MALGGNTLLAKGLGKAASIVSGKGLRSAFGHSAERGGKIAANKIEALEKVVAGHASHEAKALEKFESVVEKELLARNIIEKDHPVDSVKAMFKRGPDGKYEGEVGNIIEELKANGSSEFHLARGRYNAAVKIHDQEKGKLLKQIKDYSEHAANGFKDLESNGSLLINNSLTQGAALMGAVGAVGAGGMYLASGSKNYEPQREVDPALRAMDNQMQQMDMTNKMLDQVQNVSSNQWQARINAERNQTQMAPSAPGLG